MESGAGYVGKVVLSASSPLFHEAGMTNSNTALVHAVIDLDAPENASPTPHWDGSECIEVISFPFANLLPSINGTSGIPHKCLLSLRSE
jgi:hypothetical protein